MAARGNLAVAKLLFLYGAEADARRESEIPAIVKASEGGHIAVVQELLAHGADPDARKAHGNSALAAACFRGHNKVVAALLDAGANPDLRDKEGRTVLLLLASEKPGRWNLDTLRLLLSKGADIQARDSTGRTALLWAATNGNLGLVRALLSGELGRKSDVGEGNNRGRTALHLSADSNHQEMVALLLAQGADVDAVSDGGWTALHNAAQSGRIGVVSHLIDAHANVNAELSNGMTPLHWAAFNGHESVVKLLLTKPETNIALKDGFDRTPMLCAAERHHKQIVQLLSPTAPATGCRPWSRAPARPSRPPSWILATSATTRSSLSSSPPSTTSCMAGSGTRGPRLTGQRCPRSRATSSGRPAFRWIHLPANNIAWVEVFGFLCSPSPPRAWLTCCPCEPDSPCQVLRRGGPSKDIELFKALERSFDQEQYVRNVR